MPPDSALLSRAAARDGVELGADDARALFAAMLAGEVAPRELSAILAAWRDRRVSRGEISGFVRALDAHAGRLEAPPDGPRTVVLATAQGTLRQANLTALLALLLKRYETPVLVHGAGGLPATTTSGEGPIAARGGALAGPVTTAQVLWELGIEAAASLADAQSRLRHDGIVYLPWAVLAPGLARLQELSPRQALPAIARVPATLIDPFAGDGFRVIGAAGADDLAAAREFLLASRTDGLLFPGTEGEPFPDPRGHTPLEHVTRGVATLCSDAEVGGGGKPPSLPGTIDPVSTATWIESVLAGSEPVPPSIVVQLGCCLAGARRLGALA